MLHRRRGRAIRVAFGVGLAGLVSAIAAGALAAEGDVHASLVKDIDTSPCALAPCSSSPSVLTNVNGTLLFSAFADATGTELYRSDGTAAGTALVQDINTTGNQGSSPFGIAAIGSLAFFRATDGITASDHGEELWKSDAPYTSATRITDLQPGFPNSSPDFLTNVNGTLFFVALGSGTSKELHKTEGPAYDAGSTSIVEDINPDSNGIAPSALTNVDGTLFFNASDGAANHGQELWKSTSPYDAASTDMVEDIATGTASSSPNKLTNVGGTLLFIASDPTTGTELWKSDGAPSGTDIVADIHSGGGLSSSPENLTAIGTTLFFTADDGTSGRELWKTTPPYDSGSTSMVADIFTGPNDGLPSSTAGLTNVNGTLFFQARDTSNGFELWKSNGGPLGPGGTEMVKDINPNAGVGSSPVGLTNINGTLMFRADDGTNGSELWKSDGTPAGTTIAADINPGPPSSIPFNLTNVGGTAFFSADDGTSVARELWKATVEGSPPPPTGGGGETATTTPATAPFPTTSVTPAPTKKKCQKRKKSAVATKKCKKRK